MMRVIKFRLVYKGQIVGYEDHVLIGNGVNIRQRQPGQTMWTLYNPTEIGRFLKHDHKDQFVGLPDKDGTPIYEGDYIQWDAKNGGDIGYVEWSEDELAWIASEKEGDGAWLCGANKCGTVIGNKWENPELLK